MTDLNVPFRDFLHLAEPVPVPYTRSGREDFEGYSRERFEYPGQEGDSIPAYLFRPLDGRPVGGVVVYHQHAGQFHFGKSEVAGEVGDPFQAFGPALARKGLVVLAPDAITFEDRRTQTRGIEPEDGDWLQHYNALAYRLLDGDTLMRKVLDDAQRALSVLLDIPDVAGKRVGVAGHSYGGLVALYHAAIDTRCAFSCISGAICSFEIRRREGTGINMFEVVPGLSDRIEAHDILSLISPRPVLVVSGADDPYSKDADKVVSRISGEAVTQCRVDAGHALDEYRFQTMVNWITEKAAGR